MDIVRLEDYWDEILEVLSDEYSNKFEHSGYQYVSEAVSYTQLYERDICLCVFPYLNLEGEEKIRPTVVIKTVGGYKIFMISTAKDKKDKDGNIIKEDKRLRFPYNCRLLDYEKENLNDPSLFIGSTAFPIDSSFIKINKVIGGLTDRDYKAAKKCISYFDSMKFDSPWRFANWLQMEGIEGKPIEDTDSIQTITKIRESKVATPADVCTALRSIVKSKPKYKMHCFVSARFYENDNCSATLMYFVFGANNRTYVFRYIPSKLPVIEITDYRSKNVKTIFEKEVKMFREMLKPFTKGELTTKTVIFTKTDMDNWDRAVIAKQSGEETLMSIYKDHDIVETMNASESAILTEDGCVIVSSSITDFISTNIFDDMPM